MVRSTQPCTSILAHTTRRRFLRVMTLGLGAGVLQACSGLPGLAPTATPILFEQPTTEADALAAQPTSEQADPDVAATPPAVTANMKLELRFDYWDSSVRPVIEAFEAQHPELKVVFPVGQADELQRSNLGTITSESSAPDICVVSLNWLGEYMASDGLVDLNTAPFEAATYKADIVEACWQYGTAEGKQLAMPWLGFPSGLIYRADTLKAAGFEADPEALQNQLKRWDDFIDLGVALKAKRSDMTLISDASDLFWIALGQHNGELVRDNQVFIADIAKRPAELAARTRAEGIDGNLQQNSVAFAEFRQGRIPSFFGAPSFERFLASDLADTLGKWRLIAPPEGVIDFGTVLLAIPKQSRHKEEAWQLIQYLTTTDEGQNGALKTGSGFPIYKPAWLDPIYDQPNEIYGGQRSMRLWSDYLQQLKPLQVTKYARTIRDVIEVELFQILFSKKDPAKAMQDAQKALLTKVEGLRA